MSSTGISTTYTELDYSLLGFENGDLICMAASPNKEMRALAYNITVNLTKYQNVVIFSLNKKHQDVMDNLINIKTLGHCKDEVEIKKDLMLLEKKICIFDDVSNISEIENISKNLKHKQDFSLIVIDYLQLMQDEKQLDKKQHFKTISERLKKLAEEVNVPIIILSELPLEVERRLDHKPHLHDLKEYGIEKYSDNIIFIYREDYYNKNSDFKNIVVIYVAKSKRGETETTNLADIGTKYVSIEYTIRY